MIRKISAENRLSIPRILCKTMGIEKGTMVYMFVNQHGEIVIKKIKDKKDYLKHV